MYEQFAEVTNEESMTIEGGGAMEAVGYSTAAYSLGNLSVSVIGASAGATTLVTTGAIVACGVGLGALAVGLAGYAVYSAFN